MKRSLSTVNHFCSNNPNFTEGSIRWVIFNENTNGLKESGAIVRMGRRVFIDEDRFFAWLDEKNGIQTAAA